MNVEFRASFAKDLRVVDDKKVLKHIRQTVEHVEQASSLLTITNLKKLKGGTNYYRIRVGEYRVGITIEADTATFVRCLHRKEIYRHFP